MTAPAAGEAWLRLHGFLPGQDPRHPERWSRAPVAVWWRPELTRWEAADTMGQAMGGRGDSPAAALADLAQCAEQRTRRALRVRGAVARDNIVPTWTPST